MNYLCKCHECGHSFSSKSKHDKWCLSCMIMEQMIEDAYNIARPISIVANNRPLLHLTHQQLQMNFEVIQDEIESKGGIENIGPLTRQKYQIEIDATMQEIINRN